jgi:hypothetical protein
MKSSWEEIKKCHEDLRNPYSLKSKETRPDGKVVYIYELDESGRDRLIQGSASHTQVYIIPAAWDA